MHQKTYILFNLTNANPANQKIYLINQFIKIDRIKDNDLKRSASDVLINLLFA